MSVVQINSLCFDALSPFFNSLFPLAEFINTQQESKKALHVPYGMALPQVGARPTFLKL